MIRKLTSPLGHSTKNRRHTTTHTTAHTTTLSGKTLFSAALVTAALATMTMTTSCQQDLPQEQGVRDFAQIDVTSVDHTKVKRQSIGNCWLYASATWLESLLLTETGREHNISESYWTYWDFYHKIANGDTKLETGGWWDSANNIMLKYGFVEEGEFIPNEADVEMSARQDKARILVEKELKEGGRLHNLNSRSHNKIIEVLDEGFGVDMKAAMRKARYPQDTVVTTNHRGDTNRKIKVLLSHLILDGSPYKWKSIYIPRLYSLEDEYDEYQLKQINSRLKQVMKALNDGVPVIMTFDVDFNALDTKRAEFNRATLDAAGEPGTQGGHMLVLNDYTVTDVPEVGDLGLGDMDDEMKEKALDGNWATFHAKNSWGTNRADRGITDGYTGFTRDYLLRPIQKVRENDDGEKEVVGAGTPLREFHLPPGY